MASNWEVILTPFLSVDVKVPAFVIAGDVLRLQVAVTNHTQYPVNGMLDMIVPENFVSTTSRTQETVLCGGGETKIIVFEYTIRQLAAEKQANEQAIQVRYRSPEAFEDVVKTMIRTLDRGYPVRQVVAGNAAKQAWNLHFSAKIPQRWK